MAVTADGRIFKQSAIDKYGEQIILFILFHNSMKTIQTQTYHSQDTLLRNGPGMSATAGGRHPSKGKGSTSDRSIGHDEYGEGRGEKERGAFRSSGVSESHLQRGPSNYSAVSGFYPSRLTHDEYDKKLFIGCVNVQENPGINELMNDVPYFV